MKKEHFIDDDQYDKELQRLYNELQIEFHNYDGNIFVHNNIPMTFLTIMAKLHNMARHNNSIGYYIRENFLAELMFMNERLLAIMDSYPNVIDEYAQRHINQLYNDTYVTIMEEITNEVRKYYRKKVDLKLDKDILGTYKSIAPSHAKYIAIDSNGKVYSYIERPSINDLDGIWRAHGGGDYTFLGNVFAKDRFSKSDDFPLIYEITNPEDQIFEI